jgi:hypothetical protein
MSERLTMRKVREVLRLKYACHLPQREIAASCAISKGSVSEYLTRAREAGLTWELASSLSDAEVEARLFKQLGRNEPSERAPIDFEWIHRELRRAGVTLQLLWVEYQQAVATRGDGARPYQYSQKHGGPRTDAACARALAAAGPCGPTRKHVDAILKRGIEHAAIAPVDTPTRSVTHDNVRGASYFDKEETRDHGRNDPEAQRHAAAHDGQGPARDPRGGSRQRPLF